MLRNCFTPTDAIEAFIDSTEFEFHPTNVGMILKENKIEPVGYTKDGAKLYDGKHWEMVLSELFKKAIYKCKFDKDLIPPKEDSSIADCPQYYVEDIKTTRSNEYWKKFKK